MDLNTSFVLNVRRKTSRRLDDSGKKAYVGCYEFHVGADVTWTLEQFSKAICDQHAWNVDDEVQFSYFDKFENKSMKIKSDLDLSLMFAMHLGERSVVVQNDVVIGGRANQSIRSQPSCSQSHPVLTLDYDVPDEVVYDNEDERLYPDLVKSHPTLLLDNRPAQFVDTDQEEEEENIDMGMSGHEDDEDRPVIDYDKDNPSLAEGTIFPSMVDCRNALATYCIKGEYDFEIDKSEPSRLRVHCTYERCRWRMHASKMRDSTLIQVKVNPFPHTCPSVERKETLKIAKSRWCADVMLDWVRDNPCIGPTALIKKIHEKYGMKVPYMRVFYGKEMALDKIYGPWKDSFKLMYTFKAEVEKACPGSVVEIDKHTVQYKVRKMIMEKECFRRVFVSFKACWKGFLDGCRPYLAVDATALNGRFRGQLVAACAIDAHNWLFPVAYGVLEAESEESWKWFLQNLRVVIGIPHGLVIHTDACKGLETAVEEVFPGVEHRECMRHLAANFGKIFKGKMYDDNLWPASLTYSLKKHNYHLSQLHAANPKVKDWFKKSHSKLWMRSKFNEVCKVEYVNNNLAESFNAKVRKIKGLHLVEMLDKIRQMLMEKFELRQRISAAKFVGHKIIPSVMKKLLTKTRGLKMKMIKRTPFEAEVTAYDREKREWRYPVNLEKRTCSCRQWEITGLPCIHALFFITSLRGPAAEIDQYVDDYFSVTKFNATYADNVPCIESQHQWDIVDPGFVLHAPVQSRAPGRPRKTRIRSSAEGTGLGPRRRKCKRCGEFGHFASKCKNAVDAAFGEDQHWGAENSEVPPSNVIVTRENSPPTMRRQAPQAPSFNVIVTR
ncbi:uncharacterized protein [Zea mays]|uniref:uncharacterized protein n=1 Tax=Zea mays TaxID=4577 RepID=UPI001651C96D|nr:uncharacterized protein LOC118473066 [Zea mays]